MAYYYNWNMSQKFILLKTTSKKISIQHIHIQSVSKLNTENLYTHRRSDVWNNNEIFEILPIPSQPKCFYFN